MNQTNYNSNYKKNYLFDFSIKRKTFKIKNRIKIKQ